MKKFTFYTISILSLLVASTSSYAVSCIVDNNYQYLGTPVADNFGGTWAFLNVNVLNTSGTMSGHLEVSTDSSFGSNVITTSDMTIDSNNDEILQMVNKLKPSTTYNFRGVLNVNGQQYCSFPAQFTTSAVGASLAVSYNALGSLPNNPPLSWKTPQIGTPDPNYPATAYINWGHSMLLGHTSSKITIPTQTYWINATFQQADGVANPGDTIYWQYVVVSNGGNVQYTGNIQTSQLPSYYAPASTTNPCSANDSNNTVHLLSQNVALVCSNVVSYNDIWTDSGHSGQLNCPVAFPFNLNYTSQLTINIPKLGIPLGPFGSSVSYWRSSSNIRFNIFLPGANAGSQGAIGAPGYQKWSAANWGLSSGTAQYWTYCGSYLPQPGVNIYNGGN